MPLPNYKVILLDKNVNFLKSFKASSATKKFGFNLSSFIDNFNKVLDSSELSFEAIFISLSNPAMFWMNAITKAHETRPGCPIYLYSDSYKIDEDLNDYGVQGQFCNIKRPEELIEQINDLIGNEIDPKNDDEKEFSEQDLIPIGAKQFLLGSKSFFDVYIRIRENKYIKILNSQEKLDVKRVNLYLNKGLVNFYISKSDQDRYLRMGERLCKSLVGNPEFSLEIQADQALNFGDQLFNKIKGGEISQESINDSANFVESVTKLVNDNKDLRGLNPVKKLFSRFEGLKSNIMVLMMTGIFARKLEYISPKNINCLGLTALFSDLGVYELDPKFENIKEENLSQEELEIYRTHPEVGANILSEVPNLDQVICQSVVQHHERRDGTGYPHGLTSNQITPIASIVGICYELTKFIKGNEEPDMKDFLHEQKGKFPINLFRIVEDIFNVRI